MNTKLFTKIIRTTVTLIFVLGTILVPTTGVASAQDETGSITGLVLYADGIVRPVVMVCLADYDSYLSGSLADFHGCYGPGEDGTYQINLLPVADYIVWVQNPEGDRYGYYQGTYSSTDATRVTVSAGEITENINFIIGFPYISADPGSNVVYGYDWPMNAQMTMTIQDPSGVVEDYQHPNPVDAGPEPWHPNLTDTVATFQIENSFDLLPGYLITLTGAGFTKTYTATNFAITTFDIANKTISGIGTPNAPVTICSDNTPGNCRFATVDSLGNWIAQSDVDTFAIQPGAFGWGVEQFEDGNETYARWNVPNPYILAIPSEHVVYGMDWPFLNTELTLTVQGYIDTSTTVVAPWDPNTIEAQFDLAGHHDLVPGDEVTISGGGFTKTLTITNITVTKLDVVNDTISGTASPGGSVTAASNNVYRFATAGDDGLWTMPPDPSGFVLQPGMSGEAVEYDSDGDYTRWNWSVPNPFIRAFLSENRVDTYGWPLNTTLTLAIDGTTFPTSPTTISCSWDASCGYANFDLGPDFTLAPGQTISITDGSTTKTLTVMDLYVDSYDPINKTVSGHADPGAKVGVNVWIDNGYQDVLADGTTGSWQATYDTTSDPFLPWTAGDVTTWDEDGDATVYLINNGNIFATPEADYIELQNVTKYRTYTLTINDPTDGLFYTDTHQSQLGEGETHGDVIFPLSGFDLDAGDQITITSGHDVRSLVVAPRGTISFNTANDIITGTNLQDNWLGIGTPAAWRDVKTASSGDWSIDYKEISSNGAPVEDIYPGMDGNTYEGDSDWDFTVYNWHIPNPRFDVRANFDQIEGYEWTLGETVTLTIDNPETGKTPDYSTTEKVVVASWDPNQTYVFFNLSGTYDIQPGDEVTLSAGTITKTTTVANLSYTDFDLAADAVSGVASPNTLVHIGVCDATGCYYRHLITDGNGAWMADFARPGSEPDEQNTFDIIPGTWVDTQQYDDDGDGTLFGLNIPNPIIRAWPNRDQVDADGWTPGETVTLQVGGHELKGTAQAAYWDPNNGFVKFQLSEIVDIKPGTLVSLTNGKITKTTVVTNVQITNVDVNSDTVRGTALPGTNVDVWASYADNWFVRHATADEHGNWAVDFTHPGSGPDEQDPFDIIYWTWIEADQADEDSDLSMYGTVVPTPFNIYAMDTKTGVSSQLTQLPASGEYFPSWSPDGKYVAEGVIGIGYLGVYITNVATGKSEPLRGADGGFDPAWSPNGKWIAFFRGWMDEPNLYYVPAAGGEKKLIRENADDASWAPNSQRLVFQDLADGNKIKTVSLSGSGETIVADHGANPAWSPSGEWIAYEQDGNIWKVRVNLQGAVLGSPVQLTSGSEFKGFPAWSADEKWIVFQSGTEDNYSLWKIPAGGGTPVKVAGAPIFGDAENPSYSFNGRYLAFSGITSYPIWRNWVSPSKGDFLPGMWTNHNYRNQFIPNHTFPDRTIRLKSMVARALQFEYRIKGLMQYHRQP